MNDEEILSNAITKAIAYTENGGKIDIDNPKKGKTGEMKSIFQFTPNTWKGYSKEVFGKETPMNADTETHVVKTKVKNWIKKGYTARQIASMWNAGEKEKDAYKGTFTTGLPSKGINKKYNVPYDVPAYADKVLNYSKQFYKEKSKKNENQAQSPLTSIMATIQESSQNPTSPQS